MRAHAVLVASWLVAVSVALDSEPVELGAADVRSVSPAGPARLPLHVSGGMRTVVQARPQRHLCLDEANDHLITYHHCQYPVRSEGGSLESSISLVQVGEAFSAQREGQVVTLEGGLGESGTPIVQDLAAAKKPASSLAATTNITAESLQNAVRAARQRLALTEDEVAATKESGDQQSLVDEVSVLKLRLEAAIHREKMFSAEGKNKLREQKIVNQLEARIRISEAQSALRGAEAASKRAFLPADMAIAAESVKTARAQLVSAKNALKATDTNSALRVPMPEAKPSQKSGKETKQIADQLQHTQAAADLYKSAAQQINAGVKRSNKKLQQELEAKKSASSMPEVEEQSRQLQQATTAEVSKTVADAEARLDSEKAFYKHTTAEAKAELQAVKTNAKQEVKSTENTLAANSKLAQTRLAMEGEELAKVGLQASNLVEAAREKSFSMVAKETETADRKLQKQEEDSAAEVQQVMEQNYLRMLTDSREKLQPLFENGATPVSDTSNIRSSKDSFLCIKKFLDQTSRLKKFEYVECNKHAQCVEHKDSLECVCKPGFVGNGHRCAAVDCGALKAPANGLIHCSKGTRAGESCEVKCSDGYQLKGVDKRVCLRSGTWNALKKNEVESECVKLECESLETPEHGVQTCTGTKYGDSCRFKCEKGFALQGNPLVACEAGDEPFKGIWRGEHKGEAVCLPVDCGSPTTTLGVVPTCDGTTVGSTCNFKCESGAPLGETTQRCMENGEWSAQPVTCSAITCRALPKVPNGQYSCNGAGVNNQCSLQCNDGYAVHGKSERKCVQDKTDRTRASWSGSSSTCERIECHKLESSLINGHAKCQGDATGQGCSYSCDPGYLLSGSSSRRCKADGQWSGEKPRCTYVDCGEHANPENGKASCDGSGFRHQCSFTCNKGHKLVGSRTRVCQKDGFWSESQPKCQQVQCKRPEEPINGQVSCTGSSFDDTCGISCNKGFHASGPASIRCGAEGEWNHEMPKCVPNKCGKLNSPPHGKAHCSGHEYGSSCEFSCEDGYEVSGPTMVRKCEASGAWSGLPVTCSARACGMPDVPINGFKDCNGTSLGDTCSFRCVQGFTLQSRKSATRTCSPAGEWSGDIPVCEPKDCGPVKAAGLVAHCKSGTTLGAECTLQCESGEEPSAPTTKCLANGKWSGPPRCSALKCEPPMKPKNGRIACQGQKLRDTCTYSCDLGFQLAGSSTRTCDERGAFDGEAPRCVRQQCPRLEKLHNGIMSCSSSEGALGTKCKFGCKFGFKLKGSKERVCNEDGEWSGEDGLCERQRCDPPAVRKGCNIKCAQGTGFGAECKIVPRIGFQLNSPVKEETITCTSSGEWSASVVGCVPAHCPKLEKVDKGEMVCDSTDLVGSRCGLQCDDNTVRKGLKTKECGLQNQWTPGNMSCSPLPQRLTAYSGVGNVERLFTFYSNGGNVGVRLQAQASEQNMAFMNLVSRTSHSHNTVSKSFQSWVIGTLKDDSFSFCHGAPYKYSCPLSIDRNQAVEIRGSAYFHGSVANAASEVQTPLGDSDNSDAEPFDDVLLEELSSATEGRGYHTRVSSWANWSSAGDIGVHIESRDQNSYHDVYAEFRNENVTDSYTWGMQGNEKFSVGYGVLGTMSRQRSMTLTTTKSVTFGGDVVFHHPPSFFKQGSKLSLMKYQAHNGAATPQNVEGVAASTASADVPVVPELRETSLGVDGSAEPLVAYHSRGEVGWNIESTDSGDAFVSFKNRETAWRAVVRKDGNLYLSYVMQTKEEVDVLKMDSMGAVHFYGDVLFEGRQFRRYD